MLLEVSPKGNKYALVFWRDLVHLILPCYMIHFHKFGNLGWGEVSLILGEWNFCFLQKLNFSVNYIHFWKYHHSTRFAYRLSTQPYCSAQRTCQRDFISYMFPLGFCFRFLLGFSCICLLFPLTLSAPLKEDLVKE